MYARAFFLLVMLLVLSAWSASAWAQIPPPLPNQPSLQSPPMPPTASRPDSTARAVKRLSRPKVLQLELEDADQAVVRRYRYRTLLPDSLAALREVRDLVLSLQTDAYLTASADAMSWSRDSLHVRLYVGEQFRWAHLRNGNLGDALLIRAGYREKFYANKPFLPADWTRLQQRIIAEAENQGFPFASVRMDSVQLRGAAIEGRVVLDRGPAIVFDSLQIVGNTKTRKQFLTKYLQILPNQPYSQQRVEAAARLLRQLPYLQLKAEPEVRFSKGRARVYLLLDDRSANQFDAIVGVLPNPNPGIGQKRVQLTGDVTLNLRNLRGGGKQIGLQWRKVDVASQQLDAQYVHPSFFGTPLEVAGTFNLYKQSSAFVTLRPRLQVTYPTARAGRITFFTERRSSRLLTDLTFKTRTTLPDTIDSEFNSYGLEYSWNALDDVYFPRRGLLASLQASVGNKRIFKNADLNAALYNSVPLRSTQEALGVRVEYYYNVGRNGVLLTRLRGEALINKRLFLNDLFRLGGLATLRGFNEFAFYASQYAVSTVEFRQFTGADAYVFLFADQGILQRGLVNDKAWDAPTGLGAGLSFRTPAGMFQFVYSIGRSNNQKFSFNSSKIHFGITSRF
ncbi:BamA/TamA family outer membrane protein [Hymenobacter sp. BT491]|uniref:BamA/TamA family outer membrane protein n=1 Tax=Hymenobacter sp. BT491 TaxID=2766779 RepID=UPI0016534DEA|nr:BamA/TamA family outer membrane protein [Hymenobacter sp. BT491]MBC6991937.1 BamA/TamA family outer membrane protein [Hymenobacter sp. BT491]